MKITLAVIACLLMTEDAVAGPAIAAAFPALAAWAGTTLGTIVINTAIIAGSFGLQYLISRANQRQQDVQPPPSTRIPQRAAILDQRRVYGRMVVSGGIFFQKTIPGSGATNPNMLVIGYALSQGLCDGIEGLIINGTDCVIDELGNPDTAPWSTGGNHLQVAFRNGGDAQAMDSIIETMFTEDEEFRQRGVCTLVISMFYGNDQDHHTELWGVAGLPDIKIRLRGLRCYDPRDGSQSFEDNSSWAWTRNASLIIADWLTCSMGFGIDPSLIDWDSVAASANIDDQLQDTLDGSEERGTIDGVVFSSQSNDQVLNELLTANRAIVIWSGGKWSIRSDAPSDPVCTIHQGLLVGEFSYTNEPDQRAALNTVHCRFIPAENNNEGATVDYIDDAALAADERIYDTTLGLPFTSSPATAQRLGYAIVAENRIARTFAGQFDISVLHAPGKNNKTLEPGDVIWLEFADYPAMGGAYRVTDIEITANFIVGISMVGYSRDILEGWSEELEEEFQAEVA